MSNSVVILAVDSKKSRFQPSSYLEYCKASWEKYCDKFKFNLKIITEEDLKLPHPKWQKINVFEYVDSERILYVDSDTIVSKKCGNIFDIVDPMFIGAVKDNMNLFWLNSSINSYQKFFPSINLDLDKYFNSGVLVFTRKYHSAPLEEIKDWAIENKEELSQKRENSGVDQTLLNFWFQKRGYPIHFLPHTYNQFGLQRLELLSNNWQKNDPINHFLKTGNIYHVTGLPIEYRSGTMKQIYEIEYGK